MSRRIEDRIQNYLDEYAVARVEDMLDENSEEVELGSVSDTPSVGSGCSRKSSHSWTHYSTWKSPGNRSCSPSNSSEDDDDRDLRQELLDDEDNEGVEDGNILPLPHTCRLSCILKGPCPIRYPNGYPPHIEPDSNNSDDKEFRREDSEDEEILPAINAELVSLEEVKSLFSKYYGGNSDNNTSESVSNIKDAEMAIKTFEEELKNDKRKAGPQIQKENPSKTTKIDTQGRKVSGFQSRPSVIRKTSTNSPSDFDRGLQAEKIIGLKNNSAGISFLVKWKGSEKADFVSGKEAKQKIPQVVISFYEKGLDWFEENEDDI